jgi:hypothetical protein
MDGFRDFRIRADGLLERAMHDKSIISHINNTIFYINKKEQYYTNLKKLNSYDNVTLSKILELIFQKLEYCIFQLENLINKNYMAILHNYNLNCIF